jgi:hydroxymethylpyrimidine/phosphomethylpyrimidine kinase
VSDPNPPGERRPKPAQAPRSPKPANGPPSSKPAQGPSLVVLTIAGSDSGGGAGIQADLKTFQRFGVYGTSALTLVTAQNTLGVRAVELLSPELVAQQIAAIVEDFEVRAAKTGALGSAAIVEAVAAALEEHALPRLVVDPVMISKHGDPLLDSAAVDVLKRRLFPKARLVTPNLHEAGALLGRAVGSEAEMRDAARAVCDLGAAAALVKGGHLPGGEAVDLLYDGSEFVRVTAPRIETPHTHGTGCAYSAAIAALLARGETLVDAVRAAKDFISRAIAAAPGIGRGHGPVNHSA